MKKILFSLVVMAMIVTNVNAGVSALGTVTEVKIYPTQVAIVLKNSAGTVYSRWISGTADQQKAMLATALTAESTGKQVFLSTFGASGCNGTDWCIMKMYP